MQINHALIQRLKNTDFVSVQEAEMIGCSQELIRILVYCGIAEEIVCVNPQTNLQIKGFKLAVNPDSFTKKSETEWLEKQR